jgi:ferric-dicitrate binding protein FerR (iron transport regulator)
MDPDWLGLRDDDLDDADRGQMAMWLRDPAHRRTRDDAMALGASLRALPGTGGPSIEAVRAAVSRRRSRRWTGRIGTGAAVVATAGILAFMVVSPESVRDRGLVAGAMDVHLEAAAEGPGGLRGLRPT